MISWGEIARLVESRAGGRCEYCGMHQVLQGATFHIEHIVPSCRGGSSEPDNLAWCCPGCNLRKSDRTEARDPESAAVVPLFNPRTDHWSEHFRFEGFHLVGQTPVGRPQVARSRCGPCFDWSELLVRLRFNRFYLLSAIPSRSAWIPALATSASCSPQLTLFERRPSSTA